MLKTVKVENTVERMTLVVVVGEASWIVSVAVVGWIDITVEIAVSCIVCMIVVGTMVVRTEVRV